MLTIEKFIAGLIAANGERVNIKIVHKLYGPQTINNIMLDAFYDDERIGFRINSQEIYIRKDELVNYNYSGDCYCLASNVMKLYFMIL